MLYVSCPTCGFFLGQVNLAYDEGKAKICSNPNLTEEQINEQLSKLLLSLNIRRYCCKMRLMTAKDIVQDILPVVQDQE